jgi:hypothetical protein
MEWSERETQRLLQLHERGLSFAQIAQKLGRSVHAVRFKLKRIKNSAKPTKTWQSHEQSANDKSIPASQHIVKQTNDKSDAFGILAGQGISTSAQGENGNSVIINPNRRIAAHVGETAIVISDVQAPWQDNEALDLALAVAKDVKPTCIVFLGDIWDVSGAAGWGKNPFLPLLFNEERRITRAIYEIWCEEFPKARKKAIAGNHEERIAWGLERLPERHRWISQISEIDWASLLGLDCETTMAPTFGLDMQEELAQVYQTWQGANSQDASVQELVANVLALISKRKPKKFPSLGIEVYRRKPPAYQLPFQPFISHAVLKIGKLNFTHGHEFKMNCLAVHVGVNVLRKTKSNIIIGHWHRVGPAIDKNLEGQDIGAFLNPCLCRLDQYAFRPAWQQGISVVDFTHSGHFCVQPAIFMRDGGLGLFTVFGRKVFTAKDAPVRHRKLPPLGLFAQMKPTPSPEEML